MAVMLSEACPSTAATGGYRFSPRLADIGGARFWRIDRRADYVGVFPAGLALDDEEFVGGATSPIRSTKCDLALRSRRWGVWRRIPRPAANNPWTGTPSSARSRSPTVVATLMLSSTIRAVRALTGPLAASLPRERRLPCRRTARLATD